MSRTVSRAGPGSGRYFERRRPMKARAAARQLAQAEQARVDRSFSGWVLMVPVVLALGGASVLLGPGFVLDTPQPSPPRSDAIVVISGDEQMARFSEGVRLYQAGLGEVVVFSGAARDNGTSNADVMHDLAVARGVPDEAILEDSLAEDTWGNAIHTRRLLEEREVSSAILVTSPYHARRAKMTFDAAYAGSGIDLVVHSAPDSEWRKLSWWQADDTRRLTFAEMQKLLYIAITGRFN